MQAQGENPQKRLFGLLSTTRQPRSIEMPLMSLADHDFSPVPETTLPEVTPFAYNSHFQDCMQMAAGSEQVAAYLNAHQGWFRRCAHPMQVHSLSENAYALTIGRFGAFGYEVEPKIGLDLLPQEQNCFRIVTIPLPDQNDLDYAVDFQAVMHLCEQVSAQGSTITDVQWELDLQVSIRFPRFIYRLPMGVIQTTGDRLLRQIVRQVSRRLTHKVQQDFHSTHGLVLPNKSAAKS